MISAATRIACVFGYPVGHSLSPQMHNAAFRCAELDCVYVAFRVAPSNLADALRGAAAMGFLGVNLTIPHKVAAMELMDELTPEARCLGAVNTVQFDCGRMVGWNTDAEGFAACLDASGISGACRAVVYGAGGAARAVAYALLTAGSDVTIVNRTPWKAEKLASELQQVVGGKGTAVAAEAGSGAELRALAEASLIVNATSAGMDPDRNTLPPVQLAGLRREMVVIDLIYRPRKTRFLSAAEVAGCRTMNGVPMLVAQGAASFRIWTGCEPDVEAMRRAVESALDAEERRKNDGKGSVAGSGVV